MYSDILESDILEYKQNNTPVQVKRLEYTISAFNYPDDFWRIFSFMCAEVIDWCTADYGSKIL